MDKISLVSFWLKCWALLSSWPLWGGVRGYLSPPSQASWGQCWWPDSWRDRPRLKVPLLLGFLLCMEWKDFLPQSKSPVTDVIFLFIHRESKRKQHLKICQHVTFHLFCTVWFKDKVLFFFFNRKQNLLDSSGLQDHLHIQWNIYFIWPEIKMIQPAWLRLKIYKDGILMAIHNMEKSSLVMNCGYWYRRNGRSQSEAITSKDTD